MPQLALRHVNLLFQKTTADDDDETPLEGILRTHVFNITKANLFRLSTNERRGQTDAHDSPLWDRPPTLLLIRPVGTASCIHGRTRP